MKVVIFSTFSIVGKSFLYTGGNTSYNVPKIKPDVSISQSRLYVLWWYSIVYGYSCSVAESPERSEWLKKNKRERRKKIYGKDLPTEKFKPVQAEIPQKVEESPPVDDEPNEVMGKSNIIYYEDIKDARTIPTHLLELKRVELPVDKDINPDDVEDNFEPQKGLTEEDKRELMEPEGVIPDPDFDKSLLYIQINAR